MIEEFTDNQQQVIGLLLEGDNTRRLTRDEITVACGFQTIACTSGVLGQLKTKGIVVKSGGLWRLTGNYLRERSLKDPNSTIELSRSDPSDPRLQIDTLQSLSRLMSDDIAAVLDAVCKKLEAV
ncbi:hypothetical protein [Gayadomonas joobiniege]|uniref:hypothetical protein n=1 Tax=Gayadomonas joobiniege TaxID=1234606 RepID=UPI000368C731|nr:hypothetical protein [Gayadomonas joobiniege]